MISAVGADYPMYAESYPTSTGNPKPPVSGANGQADITVAPRSAPTAVGI